METQGNYEFYFKNERIFIHGSWKTFFENNRSVIHKIETEIGYQFTPSADKIFTIFKLPQDQISTIIIGQDPYPQPGVATGRSFEVKLSDWNRVNPSLKSILQSFYYHAKRTIKSVKEIADEINTGQWEFYSPEQLFETLEKNHGVFCLNKSLTCEFGKPNSHRDIWHTFIEALVSELAMNPNITWLLWGTDAQQLYYKIGSAPRVVMATHPVAYVYSNDESKLISFIQNSGLNLVF